MFCFVCFVLFCLFVCFPLTQGTLQSQPGVIQFPISWSLRSLSQRLTGERTTALGPDIRLVGPSLVYFKFCHSWSSHYPTMFLDYAKIDSSTLRNPFSEKSTARPRGICICIELCFQHGTLFPDPLRLSRPWSDPPESFSSKVCLEPDHQRARPNLGFLQGLQVCLPKL